MGGMLYQSKGTNVREAFCVVIYTSTLAQLICLLLYLTLTWIIPGFKAHNAAFRLFNAFGLFQKYAVHEINLYMLGMNEYM